MITGFQTREIPSFRLVIQGPEILRFQAMPLYELNFFLSRLVILHVYNLITGYKICIERYRTLLEERFTNVALEVRTACE